MKCPFEYRKYGFLSRSFESVVDSATIAGYLLVDRFFGNSKDIRRERLHYAMFVTKTYKTSYNIIETNYFAD